jgi:hypothetical protein
MNEFIKSLAFVVVAAGLSAWAFYHHYSSRPIARSDYERVGTPFFENFESTSAARSLEVSAVNPVSMALQRFVVRNEKGIWVIPSHHNYPAEAADRLAQTASSVMGIVREAYAGGGGDFERFGVFDPLAVDQESVDDLTSIGTRVTLKDASGDPLVDLIVGKPAGEPTRDDLQQAALTGGQPAKYFYVRRPDEQQVYLAKIELDISTRFSDWIDTDLLRLDPANVRRIDIDNYELSEERAGVFGEVMTLYKVQGDRLVLNRESFTDPWMLEGLNSSQEQLQLTPIVSALEILAELRIAGVRPKFKFNNQLLLTADLELNRIPELETSRGEAQLAIAELQQDLEEKGFSLTGSQEKLELASSNGQLQVGTSEGVLYTIQVGKSVEGKESEIEIGGAKAVDDSNSPEELAKIANYQEEEKNRYVMIRVSFDESLIGPVPVPPTEPRAPEMPQGYFPPEEEKMETSDLGDQEKRVEEQREEKKEASDDDPPTLQQQAAVRSPEFLKYDQDLASFEEAKIEYELAIARYQQDLIARNTAIEQGRSLVDELNQRFGEWYYVVTGSNLRSLQLRRETLVTGREPAEEELELEALRLPDISFPEVDD